MNFDIFFFNVDNLIYIGIGGEILWVFEVILDGLRLLFFFYIMYYVYRILDVMINFL